MAADAPDWLQPITMDDGLKVWRVRNAGHAEGADPAITGALLPRRQPQPIVPDLRGTIVTLQRLP
jgi:hypothetical protein